MYVFLMHSRRLLINNCIYYLCGVINDSVLLLLVILMSSGAIISRSNYLLLYSDMRGVRNWRWANFMKLNF
jgi:hypothetical protein